MSHRNGMLCPTCKTTYHLYRRYASGKCQDCSIKFKNFNFWLIVGLIDRVQALEAQMIHQKMTLQNHLKWHLDDIQTALSNIDVDGNQANASKLVASLLYP